MLSCVDGVNAQNNWLPNSGTHIMKTDIRTGLVYHPDYLKHDAGEYHPETAQRLLSIIKGLKEAGLWDKVVHLDPVPATVEQIAYVHNKDYIESVKGFCERGGGALDLDTGVSRESYSVALLAAGGCITAAGAVVDVPSRVVRESPESIGKAP